MLKENQIWPKDMKERYSRRVAVGGPECKSYSSCRNFQESKDVAYCFASSHIGGKLEGQTYPKSFDDGEDSKNYVAQFPEGDNTIYYAETQRKSGSTNDYMQFLFARLPKDYRKYNEQYRAKGSNLKIRFKPFLFSFILL